ncbi:MAG: hypothetical protein Tsb0015_08530 [Simkaniaceae bacterium]
MRTGFKSTFVYVVLALLAFANLHAEGSEENKILSRIHSLFIIKDPHLALKECEEGLRLNPGSLEIRKNYVRALAETGNEFQAIKEWKELSPLILNPKEKESIHETLAWGVLLQGKNSSQTVMKNFSLLGAFFTQDAKAVDMILTAMRGSNAMHRALAVRLAGQYGDSVLKEEVIYLLKQEKIHFVRIEVIKAVGALKIKEAGEYLKSLLYDKKASAEEKVFAIQSLAALYDQMESREILELLKNKRAGFRMLGAEVIARMHLKEYLPLLIKKLEAEPIADARMSYLNVIGLLGPQQLAEEECKVIALLCADPHPYVAITAAWVAMQAKLDIGYKVLKEKIQSEDPKIRRFASAVIAFTGKKGLPLILESLEISEDPYVQANLCYSLILLREQADRACRRLFQFLEETDKTLIMLDRQHNPLFGILSPSEVNYVPHIPNLPALVDGMTRLSLINALAMIDPGKATEAAKYFLGKSLWGLTATAAVMLLEEGEMQSLEVIKKLLQEKDEKVRLQAALALAFIGGDESAVKILENSYYHVGREIKLHILEAVGRIGCKDSIPFLLRILEEPFQSLRIAAASALIQSIYH